VRAHGDGAVVLLHTWPGGTGEGLPALLEGLDELGASFVTIDELETLP
jgi:peptidoglycan/xylan/chitin deacetylase (PgdA/CDA1 family)